MINYIFANYFRRDEISVTTMHLFEHCLYKKIENKIEEKFVSHKNHGTVINAETFVSNVFLEFYFSEPSYKELLIEIIKSINFTSKDLKLIEEERRIVLHEIATEDIDKEQKILYTALKFVSNENIMSLYDGDIATSEDAILIFNEILTNLSLLESINGTVKKHNTIIIVPRQVQETIQFYFKEDILIGAYRKPMITLGDIIANMFVSFLSGKSSESILHKELINNFGLYLAYTLDIPLYNDYCIFFYCETNNDSRYEYEINGIKREYFNENYFEKNKAYFLTYILMEDSLFKEFNKFYLQSIFCCESLTYSDIISAIKNIDYEHIKTILGVIYDNK